MAPFAVGAAVRFLVRICAQNILEVAAPLRSRNDQRTPGNGLEVLFHHRGRTLDISRRQSRNDRTVLIHGAFR
jgi:hypothetical protein